MGYFLRKVKYRREKGEKVDFFDFFKSIQKVFGNTLGVFGGHNKHLSVPHTSFLPLDPDFHGFTPLQNGTWTGEAQCPLYIRVLCIQCAWGRRLGKPPWVA